jgi:hypothetical protein
LFVAGVIPQRFEQIVLDAYTDSITDCEAGYGAQNPDPLLRPDFDPKPKGVYSRLLWVWGRNPARKMGPIWSSKLGSL